MHRWPTPQRGPSACSARTSRGAHCRRHGPSHMCPVDLRRVRSRHTQPPAARSSPQPHRTLPSTRSAPLRLPVPHTSPRAPRTCRPPRCERTRHSRASPLLHPRPHLHPPRLPLRALAPGPKCDQGCPAIADRLPPLPHAVAPHLQAQPQHRPAAPGRPRQPPCQHLRLPTRTRSPRRPRDPYRWQVQGLPLRARPAFPRRRALPTSATPLPHPARCDYAPVVHGGHEQLPWPRERHTCRSRSDCAAARPRCSQGRHIRLHQPAAAAVPRLCSSS
mmetsp:Transcript_3866/g.12512  ORF Transcript_3866/g.12512 Transcript_3866/m.12512 type:complete len:275 (+) Transcript_3866:376-1200(+)